MTDHKLTVEAWGRLQKEIPAIEPKTGLESNAVDNAMADYHAFLNQQYITDTTGIHPAAEDAINPNHYKAGNVECIEAIQESLTAEAYAGYLKGNVQKYLWRYETKHWEDPLQDLQKAEWYLERLIALVGEDYE